MLSERIVGNPTNPDKMYGLLRYLHFDITNSVNIIQHCERIIKGWHIDCLELNALYTSVYKELN